jgi:uncharacterized membrane protein
MPTETLLFTPLLILIGGLYHWIPGFTRPDLFFAVTVAPEFRRSSAARRILRNYRAAVWTATLAAAALELAAGMPAVALLIQAMGLLWGLVAAHRAAQAHAAAPTSIVEADLGAPPEGLPGGPVVAALPVLLLAALGGWAGFHWDRLPPRFPVHWGIRGADRWVATSATTVFGLLAVQACVCLLLAALAWGLLNWSRRISATGAGAAAERRFRGRIVALLIATEYLLVCPAWFALYHPTAGAVNAWGVALAAVVVAFTVSLIRGGQGGSRATAAAGNAPVGDRTPDACWKWGLIYVNPADPSILVEKRFGIGYTLNFGNRWTWLVLALLLVAPAAGLILLR